MFLHLFAIWIYCNLACFSRTFQSPLRFSNTFNRMMDDILQYKHCYHYHYWYYHCHCYCCCYFYSYYTRLEVFRMDNCHSLTSSEKGKLFKWPILLAKANLNLWQSGLTAMLKFHQQTIFNDISNNGWLYPYHMALADKLWKYQPHTCCIPSWDMYKRSFNTCVQKKICTRSTKLLWLTMFGIQA